MTDARLRELIAERGLRPANPDLGPHAVYLWTCREYAHLGASGKAIDLALQHLRPDGTVRRQDVAACDLWRADLSGLPAPPFTFASLEGFYYDEATSAEMRLLVGESVRTAFYTRRPIESSRLALEATVEVPTTLAEIRRLQRAHRGAVAVLFPTYRERSWPPGP